jgi:predicted transcriptional regulator with HTH domain
MVILNKKVISTSFIILIVTLIVSSILFQNGDAQYQNFRARCGDGICDEFEKAHPNLCPKDCSTNTRQPTQLPQLRSRTGKCGDGICDEFEKKNPNLCPKDCQREEPQPTPSTPVQEPQKGVYWNSPFGIFGVYEWKLSGPKVKNVASVNDINNYLKDIGIKWLQEMHFTKELNNTPAGINIYSRIGGEGGNKPPNTSKKYKEELRKVIKKYKGRIKYWEVGTEPSGFPPPMGWRGYAKEYATHLKETYNIIKEECPDCYVVFGGLSGVGTGFNNNDPAARFLEEVLQAGGGKYFDVFEFKQHTYNADEYTELKNKMKVYEKILHRYGIDIQKTPVFLETATHDGNPSSSFKFILLQPQSEAEQASGLLKIYIYGLAIGIDKIFWNGLIELHNFAGNPKSSFNFYGLVNNPANDGKSHKKLAYYTYKKMVEVLEESDWNNIETVQEKDGIYIYKFTKKGKSIWVAWNDTKESKVAKIIGIGSPRVRLTYAIPKKDSGKDVKNYKSAFPVKILDTHKSEVSINLDNIPVFIEEIK